VKIDKTNIIKRIDDLLEDSKKIVQGNTVYPDKVEQTVFETMSIINICYGEKSAQYKALIDLRDKFIRAGSSWWNVNAYDITAFVKGFLNALKIDLENNLLINFQDQVAGEIYGDLISLSKRLIDEGHKEPAVVLACGALEDSMKKFATKNGISVFDADLSTVVNSLKAAGLIKGTQAGVAQSYVKLRNKAFHAQFDNIELPEVSSLIAFIESFILENF
jgi:hypothetical protein